MNHGKHFQRGGRGVYKCSICERSTREAGQGNDRLCPECWELAGLENSVSDNGWEDWIAAERDALVNKAVKQGSNIEKLVANFSTLFPTEGEE
jgi:hypothetical protein